MHYHLWDPATTRIENMKTDKKSMIASVRIREEPVEAPMETNAHDAHIGQ